VNDDLDDVFLDDLAQRMQQLDEAAFEDFAGFFGPRFEAFFRGKGLPQSVAEDLALSCVTDTALKVKRFTSQGPGSFPRWVWTLVRRMLVDWLRKHRSGKGRPEMVSLTDDLVEAAPSHGAVLAETLAEALWLLSERDRSLVRMRYLDSHSSFAAIAAELGITEDACRVAHHRALRRLHVYLADHPDIERYFGAPRRSLDEAKS